LHQYGARIFLIIAVSAYPAETLHTTDVHITLFLLSILLFDNDWIVIASSPAKNYTSIPSDDDAGTAVGVECIVYNKIMALVVFFLAAVISAATIPCGESLVQQFPPLSSEAAATKTARRMRTQVIGHQFSRRSRLPRYYSSSSCPPTNNKTKYTVEYSPNFQRHIVREIVMVRDSNSTNCASTTTTTTTTTATATPEASVVLESFLWLDDALEHYPAAVLLPVRTYQLHRYHQQLAPRHNHWGASSASAAATATTSASCGLEDDPAATVIVAGGGVSDASATYPVVGSGDADDDEDNTNLDQIYNTFQNILNWLPLQVDRLLERWPPLRSYPANLLEERLHFLLAPLVEESVLIAANKTDDIDWPVYFYRDGKGAGMSIGQVSDALRTLPDPLLLRLSYYSYSQSVQKNGSKSSHATVAPTPPQSRAYTEKLTYLYRKTPSIAIQTARGAMDLWLTGTPALETISLAYLHHWEGWGWQSCRILFHAFPGCQRCSLEPSAELLARGGKATRRQLIPESLAYLQTRLHVRPWHVDSMLKTHPRLSAYSFRQLQRTLDGLQRELGLKSSDLRSMILILPSLLGTSPDSLRLKIGFWKEEVGLTEMELRPTITKLPTLLKYSLDANLKQKVSFFIDELGMDQTSLRRMTIANPTVWSRSLERHLRPFVKMMCRQCGDMTPFECGQVLLKVPTLLRYTVTTVEQKLEYLRCRLDLNCNELKNMVIATPRFLKDGVSGFALKISELESLGTGRTAHDILLENPFLLTAPIKTIQSLQKALTAGNSGTAGKVTVVVGRPSKTVWMLSTKGGNVVAKEFGSVSDAAQYAETTRSAMYAVLRSGKMLRGKVFVYANAQSDDFSTLESREANTAINLKGESQNVLVLETAEERTDTLTGHLIIHTTGCAFPPAGPILGRPRTGGMALQIRSWTRNDWRFYCSSLWKGSRIRLLPDGHTVILGYPFVRPTRLRCSLYACSEAIRVAKEWCQHVSATNVTISISCDSYYVAGLLRNASQVMEWSSPSNQGPENFCKADSNVLNLLSKSVHNLASEYNLDDVTKKNITILFLPPNETPMKLKSKALIKQAEVAARLMYRERHTVP
jgi:mTERF